MKIILVYNLNLFQSEEIEQDNTNENIAEITDSKVNELVEDFTKHILDDVVTVTTQNIDSPEKKLLDNPDLYPDNITNNHITTSTPEPNHKYYDHLQMVIKNQEHILEKTSLAKEKLKYGNEISLDQLKIFKENSNKYGKYLKMIQGELQSVSDLLK